MPDLASSTFFNSVSNYLCNFFQYLICMHQISLQIIFIYCVEWTACITIYFQFKICKNAIQDHQPTPFKKKGMTYNEPNCYVGVHRYAICWIRFISPRGLNSNFLWHMFENQFQVHVIKIWSRACKIYRYGI